jgi:nucleoid-associated protein YgaU
MKELDSAGFIDQLYKSSAVVNATPNQEPVPAKVAVKEKTPPVENKAKAVAADEMAKSVSKTVVASTDKASATTVKSTQTVSAASQQYIVKGGDTLSRLSERFYNSADKWEKIYEANRDTVKNPNYIYIGQRLTIPPDERTGT